jgi:riboflavin synthase
MFTGIVEEMGTVVAVTDRDDMTLWDGSKGKGTEMTVKGDIVLQGAYLGCSICVSGVCLTATELHDNNFKVGISPETIRRTYLGQLQPGDKVNLERACEIGGRNSGHFVQGHVDGVGNIIDKWIDGDSLCFKVRTSTDILRYIVTKGFIAVDGTSLTVCDVNSNPGQEWFTFMLVEYTQKKIIVTGKQIGDLVNLEVDILGKYLENTISSRINALESRLLELESKLMNTKSNI